MTHIFKTTAIAALIATASVPAYAAAHLDISSMTCNEYEDLSRADRYKVAVMAQMELSGSADALDTPTQTNSPEASTEAATVGDSSATAADRSGSVTNITTEGDDMARFENEITVMNGICTFNPTTTVMEAAAGQKGTR